MSMPPVPPGSDDPWGRDRPQGQRPFGSTPIPSGPSDAASGPFPAGPYPPGPYPSGMSSGPGPAPMGYAAYGEVQQPTKYSGLAIAGFVLALVAVLPCFWFWFQLPGLLAVIFSFVGMGATKNNARKGRGLAVAGLVIGVVSLLITVAFTAFIYNSDDCVVDGLELNCTFDN